MTAIVPFDAGQDAIAHSERRWPMTIHLEAWLDQPLAADQLSRALEDAMTAHPMARVRRLPTNIFTRTYRWEIVPASAARALRVARPTDDLDDLRDNLLSEKVDLDDAPPIRVLTAPSPTGGGVLMLHGHHAVLDGLGACALLNDVLRAYSGHLRLDSHEERPPVQHRRARGRTLSRTVEAARAMVTAPQPTRLRAQHPAAVSSGYVVALERLEPEETSSLRTGRCLQGIPGATLNDVLVAALHTTTAQYIARGGDSADLVSVTVPVSALPHDSRSKALQNAVLQGRTVSLPADRDSPERLLGRISEQTVAMKRQGGASAPAEVLGDITFVPAAMRAAVPAIVSLVTRDRYLDTIRLSNLGPVDLARDDDGPAVQALWFTPPARHPQSLNVGAVETCGALHLGFRACSGPWTRTTVRAFGRLYRETLDSYR